MFTASGNVSSSDMIVILSMEYKYARVKNTNLLPYRKPFLNCHLIETFLIRQTSW